MHRSARRPEFLTTDAVRLYRKAKSSRDEPRLALEYEATCRLAERCLAAGLDLHEVGVFVDGVLAMVELVETHFMRRPQLRDPADGLVLDAAVNGQAAAIVTFNRRDFGVVPARFGIELLTPAEAIRRIRP
jgi:predicted nucleic acid-binding protein